MNWWRSVQKEGHPDVSEGWPEITDIDSLANIAATIMYTTSAHHAAINFGQYDFASYIANRPSKIRRKIPAPGSREETVSFNSRSINSKSILHQHSMTKIYNRVPIWLIIERLMNRTTKFKSSELCAFRMRFATFPAYAFQLYSHRHVAHCMLWWILG